jgi:hypothetical protein
MGSIIGQGFDDHGVEDCGKERAYLGVSVRFPFVFFPLHGTSWDRSTWDEMGWDGISGISSSSSSSAAALSSGSARQVMNWRERERRYKTAGMEAKS